jgi:hypothetical protein
VLGSHLGANRPAFRRAAVGVSAPGIDFGVPPICTYADLGLNASFSKSLTGFLRWRGEARAHTYSNQISGGLAATF